MAKQVVYPPQLVEQHVAGLVVVGHLLAVSSAISVVTVPPVSGRDEHCTGVRGLRAERM
jgi:hypothetical protein